MNYFNF